MIDGEPTRAPSVTRQRRRDLEQLVQPADGPVLPPRHRRSVPVPDLQRPAGQRHGRHRQPQRLRRDHLPRLASGRRRRARLRRSRPAAIRTSSTAAAWAGTPSRWNDATGQVAERLAVAGLELRRAADRRASTATPGSRRSPISPRPPHPIYFGAQVLFRSIDQRPVTGQVDQPGSVAARSPERKGLRRGDPARRAPAPAASASIFTIALSPRDRRARSGSAPTTA